MRTTDTRRFPLCIPLRESAYQYTSQFDDVILSRVRDIYEGRCFRGCKIIEILGITVDDQNNKIVTMPEFDNMRRDNTAVVNIMVDATVLSPNQYDIIPNCKVVSITPTSILCDWEHGSAMIKNNKILQTIKVGQTIPVRVGDKRCTYAKHSISVSALSFIPVPPTQPVFATDDPSDDDVKYITDLYQGGVDYYEKVKGGKLFNEFASLLSPNATEKKEVVDIRSIIDKHSKFIGTRAKIDDPVQPHMIIVDENIPSIQVKWVAAMSIIIDDWIDTINNCYELSEVYSKDDLYSDSKNIWDIYKVVKSNMH